MAGEGYEHIKHRKSESKLYKQMLNYVDETTSEVIKNKGKMEDGAIVERNAFQKRQGRLWRG